MTSPPADSDRRPRVLVVDDTGFGRAFAGHLLEALGCECAYAENGLAAVEAVGRGPFDVVFMDAEMPVMDGVTATRLLHSRHRERCPRVVATTGHAESATHEQLFDAGAALVLVKPLTSEALRSALEGGDPHRASPARAGDRDPVIDVRVLGGLRALEAPGAPSFVRQVVEIFGAESLEAIGRLRRSFEQARWAELAATAHALKGAALTVGATRVARTCAVLEWADAHPPLAAELAEAEQEIARALRELGVSSCG